MPDREEGPAAHGRAWPPQLLGTDVVGHRADQDRFWFPRGTAVSETMRSTISSMSAELSWW